MAGSPVHIPNRVHNAMVALQNKYKTALVTGEDLAAFSALLYKELDAAGKTAVFETEDGFAQQFTEAFTDTMAHENAWNALRIVTYRAFGHDVQVRRPMQFSKPAPKKKATGKKPKAKAKSAAA